MTHLQFITHLSASVKHWPIPPAPPINSVTAVTWLVEILSCRLRTTTLFAPVSMTFQCKYGNVLTLSLRSILAMIMPSFETMAILNGWYSWRPCHWHMGEVVSPLQWCYIPDRLRNRLMVIQSKSSCQVSVTASTCVWLARMKYSFHMRSWNDGRWRIRWCIQSNAHWISQTMQVLPWRWLLSRILWYFFCL